MIVQSTLKFVDSLNRLWKNEIKTVKRYLRPLCAAIEALPPLDPLTNIALSDFQILESKTSRIDLEVDPESKRDKIYDIFFDKYYLAVAVVGKYPQICQLLLIARLEKMSPRRRSSW